jgi:hypothetical protein
MLQMLSLVVEVFIHLLWKYTTKVIPTIIYLFYKRDAANENLTFSFTATWVGYNILNSGNKKNQSLKDYF